MNVVVTAAHVYIYLHTYSISFLPPIASVLYSFLNVLQALNGRLHVPLVDTLAFIVFTGSMLKHDGPQLEPAPYKTPKRLLVDLDDCNNWQGITLLTVPGKVLCLVLLNDCEKSRLAFRVAGRVSSKSSPSA